MTSRVFGIAYLLVHAAAAAAWWAMLLVRPESRLPFMATGAPDSTLLAFGLADGLIFVGASAACGYGFARCRPWAWPLLCVHAGGAGYAALYCWTLFALTGNGWLGAALMSPSLAVPGFLVWKLRPLQGVP